MKTILISGISGFVGKNVKKFLSNKGFEIFKINREGDLEKDRFDAVIHLAGKVHDIKKLVNPGEYYQVNTELTKTLYNSFLSSQGKVFIFFSSIKAVADRTDFILEEDFIPNPQTHYGKSKLLAEEYILANLPLDKRVYIFRPCMIHGEDNKGNLTLFYNFVKKGIPYPLGSFENKRSFLSIDNLNHILNEVICRDDIPSGIYHLSDDEPVSTRDLLNLISIESNIKISVWNVPKILIKILAKIGDIIPLPINTDRLEKMTENYIVSNNKIKFVIGGKLPLTSLEGLKKTINSFGK